MPRYIDADAFFNDFPGLRDYEYASQNYEVDAEPTEEQVKEYCRKRCLVIVTSELFNEMKARWSAEPVKHGHWNEAKDGTLWCSVCISTAPYDEDYYGYVIDAPHYDYCPHCGAKMDEVEDAETN